MTDNPQTTALPTKPTEAMKRAGAAQMWEEHKQGIVGLPGAERIYKAMVEAFNAEP